MNLWRSLNSSSNFAGEPIGAFYNQMLHVCLGVFFMVVGCVVWRMAFGEMPIRWYAAGFTVAAYFGLIETGVQRLAAGWKDALEDSGYVGLGAFSVAASVQEVFVGSRVVYELDLGVTLFCIFLCVAAPIFYARQRS